MRTTPAFFFFIFLTAVLSACKDRERAVTNGGDDNSEGITENGNTASNPIPSTQGTTGQISDTLVFSLERGACFGTCPFYFLHVYESGFATFNGKGHVEMMGMYHTKVPADVIRTLKEDAERMGFFDLEAEYDGPVTDLPATIITIRRNGDTKQVKGRVSPPASFRSFTERAEELLLPLDWRPAPTEVQH